jgi:hypothetical protein
MISTPSPSPELTPAPHGTVVVTKTDAFRRVVLDK